MERREWIEELSGEDRSFLKRFLLSSGSLKALAKEYGVSYPTIRARLDRLIAKVEAIEESREDDPFERRVRILVAEGAMPEGLARELIEKHRNVIKNSTNRGE